MKRKFITIFTIILLVAIDFLIITTLLNDQIKYSIILVGIFIIIVIALNIYLKYTMNKKIYNHSNMIKVTNEESISGTKLEIINDTNLDIEIDKESLNEDLSPTLYIKGLKEKMEEYEKEETTTIPVVIEKEVSVKPIKEREVVEDSEPEFIKPDKEELKEINNTIKEKKTTKKKTNNTHAKRRTSNYKKKTSTKKTTTKKK